MINILAIETSCDETACAIVQDGRKVISDVIYSQIKTHELYGGVVPEIASRKHIDKIDMVVSETLKKVNMNFSDIDAIAVTSGPGLIGALLVGVSYAKGLSYALGKPLVPVHHIEGHIASNYIDNDELKPPFICLVVSGGHSNIIKVEDYTKFKVIGKTRDDACGEAFDKVARVLGLGYPGGPKLEKLALDGNPNAIRFPQAKITNSKYDYSFSGIKSSVLNYINKNDMMGLNYNKADVAASFQEAVSEVLVNNAIMATIDQNLNKIAIAGGVSANQYIRNKLAIKAKENNIKFFQPNIKYSTDNAVMIGSSAYFNYINKEIAELELNAVANIEIGCHDF